MLGGRIAFVSGGGRGIGRAVSRVLAREGAKVAVADLDEDACKETIKGMSGENHLPLVTDVSSMSAVKEVADKVHSHFGSPGDVVVNCAGITKDTYLLKMTEEVFDKVIDVNLKGTFNVNKAFAEKMVKHQVQPGSIVNVSSIVAHTGNRGQTNYAASKAGVISFTKSAAKELAQFGIRVNCICPGFIQTPMIETIPEHLKQMVLLQIPLGKTGEPEDIAEMAAFLASERSKYITGADIDINGGLF